MKVLEMFFRTGSFSRAVRAISPYSYIVGTDIIELSEYSCICDEYHKEDILTYPIEVHYEPGFFDAIWVSSPCDGFTVCRIGTNWHVNNTPKTHTGWMSVMLVKRALDIVEYLKPKYVFFENPRGKLRKLDIIPYPMHTISYCQYQDHLPPNKRRMKPTDIWGTIPDGFPVMCCTRGDDCHTRAPRGSHQGTEDPGMNKTTRSIIPRGFCELLVEHIIADRRNKKIMKEVWF